MIGTWCEYAKLHYLHCAILSDNCAILPDNVNMKEYSGSTAGTSATGIAMLGICLAYNFPIISIARTEDNKKELEELGVKNIVVQNDGDLIHKS